jgi:hypothetical protein
MSSNGTSPAPAAGRPRSTAVATEDAADPSSGRGRQDWQRGAPPAVAPPRTRRRRGVLAAGVALVALGALGAAYLTETAGGTVAVIAVVRDVAPGQVVQAADLTIADINTHPALSPVPADRLQSMIGHRAAAALTAGSLLTDAAVTSTVVPAQGRSLVGVALTAAQLPDETGLTVVNVMVPSGQAADLAARVATGRVALVLDSRER